ncbi:MAG: DNA integrity scanning protein DisA nucleotide-binding domain protein [Deltaproteobacteria bacterium]|nr:DNA integrity scanning protein DisA nucleotide-binding domain protein [Deltaproteobacteria bacterium]
MGEKRQSGTNPVNLTKILEANKRIAEYELIIFSGLKEMTKVAPKKAHGLLIFLGDYYGQDLPEFTFREGQNPLAGQEPKYVTDDEYQTFMTELADPDRDGAVIIDRGAGQIAALDVLAETDINAEVEPGLGMRHKTAAHISTTSRCIAAFVLNETWTAVRVYRNGVQDYVYKKGRSEHLIDEH